jgi:hypothetical protein
MLRRRGVGPLGLYDLKLFIFTLFPHQSRSVKISTFPFLNPVIPASGLNHSAIQT